MSKAEQRSERGGGGAAGASSFSAVAPAAAAHASSMSFSSTFLAAGAAPEQLENTARRDAMLNLLTHSSSTSVEAQLQELHGMRRRTQGSCGSLSGRTSRGEQQNEEDGEKATEEEELEREEEEGEEGEDEDEVTEEYLTDLQHLQPLAAKRAALDEEERQVKEKLREVNCELERRERARPGLIVSSLYLSALAPSLDSVQGVEQAEAEGKNAEDDVEEAAAARFHRSEEGCQMIVKQIAEEAKDEL